jgi:hypothetical protein
MHCPESNPHQNWCECFKFLQERCNLVVEYLQANESVTLGIDMFGDMFLAA